MTRNYLIIIILATVLFAGCTKTKSVSLVGQDFYLVLANLQKSKYVQIVYQFKEKTVAIFSFTSQSPMYADVTVGSYSFDKNIIELPLVGSFQTRQIPEGFDLYNKGVLKYRLTKKVSPFNRPEANSPQHQSLFALITSWR